MIGAGSIVSARVFQHTFGFKMGEIAIFFGASGIRGGGALARRSAGFGMGAAALFDVGSGFPRITVGEATDWGFGLGSATIEGFCRCVSIAAASRSAFFGLREGATVLVK